VKQSLNLNFNENDEIAPLIVGSVVSENGPTGFNRKLRMVRADLFTMLSVCQANDIVNLRKQTVAIKKGVSQFLVDNQKINQQECIDYFKGWERIIFDKCKRNESTDVAVVNMPPGYEIPKIDKRGKKMKDPECSTFVYAAYLPPGRHQFLIYCPIRKSLFCKDIVIDLNSSD